MKRIALFLTMSLSWINSHSQTISAFAGNGTSTYTGDGSAALSVGISLPVSGAFDKNDNYYFIAGVSNNRVRMVTPMGTIHTIAGVATGGFSGDGGPATAAQLLHPYGVALDSNGNLYIADYDNFRVRKITAATGIISTIAGNGSATSTGDGGAAVLASVIPYGICIDKHQNIYIIDNYGSKVRKIMPSGIITTVAGTNVGGFSGDGGPATSATLTINYGICTDSVGDLYIASNSRIRKVSATSGVITTIAGTSSSVYTGEGIPATAASFNAYTIGMDVNNNKLYVADIVNDRVYAIDNLGMFHLVAGNGTSGYSGDGGLATLSQLSNPEGVAVDNCGNLYVADDNNYRIRKVTFNPPTASSVSITGITAAPLGSTVTVNATVSGTGGSYSIKWFNKGVQFATTSVPVVTYTKTQDTDSITAKLMPTIRYCYDSSVSGLHIITKTPGGISGAASDTPLLVYPNPATDVIYISGAGVADVVINDVLGKAILHHRHSGGTSNMNIAALPPAVYTIRVIDANGINTTQKLIKQ